MTVRRSAVVRDMLRSEIPANKHSFNTSQKYGPYVVPTG